MTLAHVQRGQPLRIGASDWNAMVDAARAHMQEQLSRDAGPATTRGGDTGMVLVRNNSGADRDRFAVLGIDSPIISPTDNADEFGDGH